MKGLELSEKFYNEFGAPMIRSQFSAIENMIAVGLCGSGSECFGFDDEISADHDFEPGFCMFIPDEEIIDRKTAFALEKAYNALPKEFMGYKRSIINPVGGRRTGVIRIGDFFKAKTGSESGILSASEWFSVPEHSLAEAVNGKIFRDDLGMLSEIRSHLSKMPENVRLKKLAGNLLLTGQSGQYNYSRCLSHKETAAAQLAAFEFVHSALRCIFLLNSAYMPYYKWSFRALKQLPLLSYLYGELEYLISSGNGEDEAKKKTEIIEKICAAIISEVKKQGLSDYTGDSAEGHAYSVNNKITDSEIRNLHILFAV
ncbi:MAG: DUF4037 domain-containing protein [Clostridia bacterium]|nr:DUF4037 domain-containing protein [Clostridia bacterium]